VLGTDPNTSSPAPIATGTTVIGEATYPTVRFIRRQDLGGVVVTVQVSENLDFSPAMAAIEVSSTPQGNGTAEVVVRSPLATDQATRQFFRVTATLP
jgi:hypothetical protein